MEIYLHVNNKDKDNNLILPQISVIYKMFI